MLFGDCSDDGGLFSPTPPLPKRNESEDWGRGGGGGSGGGGGGVGEGGGGEVVEGAPNQVNISRRHTQFGSKDIQLQVSLQTNKNKVEDDKKKKTSFFF